MDTTNRDPYYGYGPIASLSTTVITILFPPTGSPQEQSCQVLSESGKRMPMLIDFIAYALYRTRLPEPIVHSALLLLTRLKQRYPSARGTPSSPHRLFLSALMLASKMSMDDTYSNKSWVIVGQNLFNLSEVNRMERELFGFLNSNCYITKAELNSWCQEWCGFDEEEEEEEEEEFEDNIEIEKDTKPSNTRMPLSPSMTRFESSQSNSPVSCSTTTTSSPPPRTPDEAPQATSQSKFIGQWNDHLTVEKPCLKPVSNLNTIQRILNSPI